MVKNVVVEGAGETLCCSSIISYILGSTYSYSFLDFGMAPSIFFSSNVGIELTSPMYTKRDMDLDWIECATRAEPEGLGYWMPRAVLYSARCRI